MFYAYVKIIPIFLFSCLFMSYQKHQRRAVQSRALPMGVGYFSSQGRQLHD